MEDKQIDMDELFMRRCIQLATLAGGYNAPNPRVGAVIVYQGKIIGEGYHQRYGEGHAEVNAVASVPKDLLPCLPNATIYVTLEPCFHYGKTPPCVDLILQHNIGRVVIACTDPFEKVGGRSLVKLKEHGVEVRRGVLEAEAAHLVRRFFTTVQKKRPYVVLKYAQSKDGFIGVPNEEIPISNALSKRLTHQWRGEETAILVGTNTALVDDPQLNNRLGGGRNPLRLVLDRSLRLPRTLQLFDGCLETWVFTAETAHPKWDGVRFVTLNFKQPIVPQLLAYLQKEKIQSLLVEGGAQLLQSFIDSGSWDEARVFTSKAILGAGVQAPQVKNYESVETVPLADNSLTTYWQKH